MHVLKGLSGLISCLILAFAVIATPARAAPHPGGATWSDGQANPQAPLQLHDQAYHCATALAAFGLAFRHAAFLLELEDVPVPSALPARLVTLAGGPGRLPEITEAAATGWRDHWQSMAITNFYPRLAAEGTPYLTDDGRVLMDEIHRCVDRFGL